MLERELESILVREVRRAGGIAYKFVSPGNDGVPDRIVILPGRDVIFLELKTETGRLSKVQKTQIRKLMDCKKHVEVVYGPKGLIDFFREIGLPDAAYRLEKKAYRDARSIV
jgi:tRNA G37 N-methylase Trm5